MTLLTTEIHPSHGGAVIVFAADRRITRGTQPTGSREKILRLPGVNAGLGYFGLAEVPTSGGNQPMDDWVRDFFYTVQDSDSLEKIANNLASHLNSAVPSSMRHTESSGFHLAGFNGRDQAEFWYVRNLDDYGMPTLGQYEVREDFQRRDAPNLQPGQIQIYRNGDIRAHVAAWEKIDESFSPLLRVPGFRGLQTVEDYVGWVKFKMDIIAQFYERYSEESIIGSPIDAFALASVSSARM